MIPGKPTQMIIERRRGAKFITPIPKPKKRKAAAAQTEFVFDERQAARAGDKLRQYPSSADSRSAARVGRGVGA